ncbi:MAG: glycosyltransferase [Planctomycetes bacterium]|nr:glycosyltransferase [Planctomycetota bacterium]
MPFSNASPTLEPNLNPSGCHRVLMVTGIFPPLSQVGVLRSLKFSKYLTEFGCKVDVLAYKPRIGVENIDESLAREIPSSVRVHRTNWIIPTSVPAVFARKKSRESAATRNRNSAGEESPYGRLGRFRSSGFYRFMRHLPDNISPWIPMAILRGLPIALRCDCIYASAPPFSTHVIGLWLHRLTRKPLIVDFRDPWIGNEGYSSLSPRNIRLHERWERSAIRAAKFAISVTDPRRDIMAGRYPGEPAEKFVTILNGVDHEEIAGLPVPLERTLPPEPLTMSYFGSLYGSRTPQPLIDAVRTLKEAGQLIPRS